MNTLFDLGQYEMYKPSGAPILVVNLNPMETECAICGKHLVVPYSGGYTLPMYEGKVINPDIQKDWGGFFVHKKCYEENKYKTELDAFGIPRDQFL